MMRLLRRACLPACATAVAIGCTTDATTADRAIRVPLEIRATVVASERQGHTLAFDVGYRRVGGARVALTADPASVSLGDVQAAIPVSVNIDRCLGDAERAPAGQPGCALEIMLRLRGATGVIEDSVLVVPSQSAQPGATISTPSVQLYARYLLSLSAAPAGTGGGSIVSNPSGISCQIAAGGGVSGQCSAQFSGRNSVRLVATGATGTDFSGWGTGAPCSGTGDCVVTLTGALTLSPSFTLRRLSLAVALGGSGQGSVAVTSSDAANNFTCAAGAPAATCTRDLAYGSTAQLVASASAGSRFVGWSGACSGSGSCSVTMTTAQSIGATFDRLPTLVLAPRTVAVTDTIGRLPPAAATIAVSSTGGALATLAIARVEYDPGATGWLDVDSLRGPTPQSFGIRQRAITLPVGTFGARVIVSAPGAVNVFDTVFVQRTVVAAPIVQLVVTPVSVNVTEVIGNPLPAGTTISVTSTGGVLSTLSITGVIYSSGATGWLDVDSLRGPTPASFAIRQLPVPLPVGQYTARVLVSAPGAVNALETVTVQRTVVPAPAPTWRLETTVGTDDLRAVSGFGATSIMAVGSVASGSLTIGSAVLFNGSTWGRAMPTTIGPNYSPAFGVTAVPGGGYMAATSTGVLSYAGATVWNPVPAPPQTYTPGYTSIHAAAANAIMAVGLSGEVLTFDGSQWMFAFAQNFPPFTSVWNFDQTSAVAVAASGEALVDSSGFWTSTPFGSGTYLRGVWAADRSFAIAVGSQGTILLFDGSTWRTMSSPTTQTLHAVYGTSRTNIIAVGDAGTILRYDGVGWRQLVSPTQNPLYGVWLFGTADGVAVGGGGTILRYTPQ
jgi:hypothetical protein